MIIIGNRIKKKMKSKKGTSIFFGLLLFLVASILSTVMLSASVTAVKRVASDKKSEQKYLTCSSAAKLLRDAIVSTSVNYHQVTVTKTQGNGGTYTEAENKSWNVSGKTETSSISSFAEFLKKYVQDFANFSATDPDTLNRTYTISVPGTTDPEAVFDQVTANCTIRKAKSGDGFDIVIKLTTGENADDCQIVVYLTGTVKETKKTTTTGTGTSSSTTTTTIDRNYTWDATDFIYGDQERTSEAS